MCAGVLLLLAVTAVTTSAQSVLVGVLPDSQRGLPLLGFGNEAALQNVNDPTLAIAAATAGSRVLRYPGGAPSNTWDWEMGCCVNQSNKALCVKSAWNYHGGFGTARPEQWASYANRSRSPLTVFDLNVVTSNASHQVEGLRRLAAAGVPVTHLELGNELYDYQQNLGKWSDGKGYAEAMLPFLARIGAAFPQAQTAVVGSGWWPRMDAAWNRQVLVNTSATATTFHFYTSLDTHGITPVTVVARAPGLLAQAFTTAEQIHTDAEAQIPQQLRIWVTEFGHYGTYAPDNWATKEIDGTWLEGLFSGAALLLVLRISRVDVALPYCLVCADANAPAFTTGRPWGSLLPANESGKFPWSLTPRGAVLSAIMSAVNGAARHGGGGGSSRRSKNRVVMHQLDFWQAAQVSVAPHNDSHCGQAGIGAGGYCLHYERTLTSCACQRLCARHIGCQAWQWIQAATAKDYQTCYLKNVADLSASPESVSDACWSTNGTDCLPLPLNRKLLGWVFTEDESAVGVRVRAVGVVGIIMLHLGDQPVTLDFSGLFDQSGGAEWVITVQHQRVGPRAADMGLLGNMSTVVREVTTVKSADAARRVVVPPFAVIALNCTGKV